MQEEIQKRSFIFIIVLLILWLILWFIGRQQGFLFVFITSIIICISTLLYIFHSYVKTILYPGRVKVALLGGFLGFINLLVGYAYGSLFYGVPWGSSPLSVELMLGMIIIETISGAVVALLVNEFVRFIFLQINRLNRVTLDDDDYLSRGLKQKSIKQSIKEPLETASSLYMTHEFREKNLRYDYTQNYDNQTKQKPLLCPRCGNKVNDKYNFCIECGYKLS